MDKIIKKIRIKLYFLKREGACYLVSIAKYKLGKFSYVDCMDKREKKRQSYFAGLSQEYYEKEIYAWLKLLIKDGDKYNIVHPTTFNEKIQYLKVHDTTELKSRLSDKFAVREWIKETIGEEYLIPLVGGPWEKAEDIDIHSLPPQFVLKANHGSGMNIIVTAKSEVNRKEIEVSAGQWLNTLFGCLGVEAQYFSIPRKIIAEKYIEQMDGNLLDYKIYCFNGQPRFFQMIGNRDLVNHTGRLAFYDTEWNLMDFNTGDYLDYEYLLEKPENLTELLRIGTELAKGFKFVRVDLYVIEEKIKFGEMTFTPGNGVLPWKPMEADKKMGEMLEI